MKRILPFLMLAIVIVGCSEESTLIEPVVESNSTTGVHDAIADFEMFVADLSNEKATACAAKNLPDGMQVISLGSAAMYAINNGNELEDTFFLESTVDGSIVQYQAWRDSYYGGVHYLHVFSDRFEPYSDPTVEVAAESKEVSDTIVRVLAALADPDNRILACNHLSYGWMPNLWDITYLDDNYEVRRFFMASLIVN